MHASMRANMISTAVNANRRIGFDRARARDYQWLFTNERIPAIKHQHVMDGLFGFTEYLGISNRIKSWNIPVDEANHEYANSLSNSDQPLCIISPCSSQRANNFRNWSIENYIKLIGHIQDNYNAKIVLTGAPTKIELEYAEGILASTQQVINLIGQTSLKRLLALIDCADLLICPDSGPAHMATAVNTPVIGLYATSNPERTGPYGSQQLTVNRYPEAIAKEFGKEVQELRWGQRVRDPAAMDLISVQDVVDKADRVLADISAANTDN
jgi:heptosyltransferase I